MTVVHLADANGSIGKESVFLVNDLEEVGEVVHSGGMEVILQHDDVQVVENLVWLFGLEGVEGGKCERRLLRRDGMGRR